MITKDYVSIETAKLLKEKGFDEKCISVYHDGELQLVCSLGIVPVDSEQIITYITNSECEWSPIMISAPTLQTAMRWLREVHNIALNVCYFLGIWSYSVCRTDFGYSELNSEDFDTYEEACDKGIKYCLKYE